MKIYRFLSMLYKHYQQRSCGSLYSQGLGVPQDNKLALRWFAFAAEKGLPEAQVIVGLMHLEGKGTRKNNEMAVRWFTLAAEKGYAEAQNILGMMYLCGDGGVLQDERTAIRWFTLASRKGHEAAQRNLDMIRDNEGFDFSQDFSQDDEMLTNSEDDLNNALTAFNYNDFETAFYEFTPLAEQGVAEAQYKLGWMCEHGKISLSDYKIAKEWYTLAAKQGHADAQYNLGLMCLRGNGGRTNSKMAKKWFALAAEQYIFTAEQGDAHVQCNLGYM